MLRIASYTLLATLFGAISFALFYNAAFNPYSIPTALTGNLNQSAQDPGELPAFSLAEQYTLVRGIESIASEPLKPTAAMSKLPDWLAKDLPFDPSRYFGLAEEKNGAQHYYRSAVRLQADSVLSILPNKYSDPNRDPELKRTIELSRMRSDRLYYFLDSSENNAIVRYPDEFRQLMASYQTVIDDVTRAQSYADVQISRDFSIDALSSIDVIPREYARLVATQSQSPQEFSRLSAALDSSLKLAADFAPLADSIAQLNGIAAEGISYEFTLRELLRKAKTKQETAELIDILQRHAIRNQQLNRFLESTRHEYLTLSLMLNRLKQQTFQLSKDTLDYLSVDRDAPPNIQAYQGMSLRFYRTNKTELKRVIELAANANGETAQSIRKEMDAIKEPWNSERIDAAVLLPAFAKSTMAMTEADYAKEFEILKQRCRDVEAACSVAYPERITKMMALQESWTTTPAWKQTKFLKWFQPILNSVPAEVRSDINSRAYLCLASVRHWQLTHDGELPASVEAAVEFANVDPKLTLDPQTGKPFKLIRTSKCGIYSIGPDQVDDGGKVKTRYASIFPQDKGDIVFDLYGED